MHREDVRIALGQGNAVTGSLIVPDHPIACYVMAHGAGAGMRHPFMDSVATGLADRSIASLRYQFPYTERGSKQPDRPEVAKPAVRAAVEAAAGLLPGIPFFAGGKSFGGRMTSQAQAEKPLPGVAGLVFFGFPLHPAGKPSIERAEHLQAVKVPMLFLQGTRDALAAMDLLLAAIKALGKRTSLFKVVDADHGFHVAARSGKTDTQVMGEMLDAMAKWMVALKAKSKP